MIIDDSQRVKNILFELSTVAHVPKVIDLFKENYLLYIFTTHMSGKSLRKLMLGMGKNSLPENEVRKFLYALLAIVNEIHKRGIKHGNINLDTVMTTRLNGRIKIKLDDFENARVVDMVLNKKQLELVQHQSSAQKHASNVHN